MEKTHVGAVVVELQPGERTHIGAVHEVLHLSGGTVPWDRGIVRGKGAAEVEHYDLTTNPIPHSPVPLAGR